MNTSRPRWLKRSSDSRKPQMLVACHRLTSPSANVPMSKNTISALEDLPRKYLGPYDLIAQVGTHSFTLKLPDALRSVHPVFHVSMLKPHTPSSIPNHTEPPPMPVEVDGELK